MKIHKVHSVAKGYNQNQRIYYHEKFSLIVKTMTIRSVIALLVVVNKLAVVSDGCV